MNTRQRLASQPLRQASAVLAAAVLTLIAACGGGGGDTGTTVTPAATTPTATAYSQGSISGFGSIIVNGVRWDDSKASVSDDDGNKKTAADLKLGMVVEVDGGSVNRATVTSTTTGAGEASAIRFGAEMLGPVGSIDATASTFTLLGQTVLVTTSTVFDTGIVGGLAGLAKGLVVEVHGLFDAAANRTVATRVELKAAATEYRLRGAVAGLNTTAKTFTIGSETISYAGLTEVPSTLANGVGVKVKLKPVQTTAGVWDATKLRLLKTPLADRPEAEVEGVITVLTSATSFEINGLKVDASAASFPDGQAAVVLGARVEVHGAVSNGVLVASKVEVEDEKAHEGKSKSYELHGAISGLDTTAKTFALRGLTVSYAGSVTYSNISEATLANGSKVEVKGTLSSDRTRIEASAIKLDK